MKSAYMKLAEEHKGKGLRFIIAEGADSLKMLLQVTQASLSMKKFVCQLIFLFHYNCYCWRKPKKSNRTITTTKMLFCNSFVSLLFFYKNQRNQIEQQQKCCFVTCYFFPLSIFAVSWSEEWHPAFHFYPTHEWKEVPSQENPIFGRNSTLV